MRKLVTGATGLIGSELSRQLVSRDVTPVLVSRRGGVSGGRHHAIDLEHQTLPVDLLEGVDTVYHLAGVAHQQASDDRYQRLNVMATLALARVSIRAGVRTFVFVSSVKAMGPAVDAWPRSEDDLRPCRDPYACSKRTAEDALCTLVQGSGMRLVIVRPALVYGASLRGNLCWMAYAARLGLPRPPAGGGRSMISAGDLADLLCRLPDDIAASGSDPLCLIATDGQCYSSQRIYDCLRRASGRTPRTGQGSTVFWRTAALGLDILQRQASGHNFLKLFGWEYYSNQRVLSLTRWRPRDTLETSTRLWAGGQF